jgi:hypothetical protein
MPFGFAVRSLPIRRATDAKIDAALAQERMLVSSGRRFTDAWLAKPNETLDFQAMAGPFKGWMGKLYQAMSPGRTTLWSRETRLKAHDAYLAKMMPIVDGIDLSGKKAMGFYGYRLTEAQSARIRPALTQMVEDLRQYHQRIATTLRDTRGARLDTLSEALARSTQATLHATIDAKAAVRSAT